MRKTKAADHLVIYNFGALGAPLHEIAKKIFACLEVDEFSWIETSGANQSFDFYWQGALNGLICQVSGDQWDAKLPQQRIFIKLRGGEKAVVCFEPLTLLGAELGAKTEVILKGAH